MEQLNDKIKTDVNVSLSVVPTNNSGFFISYKDVNMYYCDLSEEEPRFNIVAFNNKDIDEETYDELLSLRQELIDAIKSLLIEL